MSKLVTKITRQATCLLCNWVSKPISDKSFVHGEWQKHNKLKHPKKTKKVGNQNG